jgi:hypothetical protein
MEKKQHKITLENNLLWNLKSYMALKWMNDKWKNKMVAYSKGNIN